MRFPLPVDPEECQLGKHDLEGVWDARTGKLHPYPRKLCIFRPAQTIQSTTSEGAEIFYNCPTIV